MSKRKNRGTNKQAHPGQSFEQLVASATQAKFSEYIDSQIEGAAQAILQRQQQALRQVYQRIVCMEQILMETVPGLTKDDLANRVASVQDTADGFEPTESDATVNVGDRIRLEIKTRTADQAEFQGASRLQIDNVGSGDTLGKELETAVIGLHTGETKEIQFGKDNSLVANLTVHKISRRSKSESAEAKEEAKDSNEPSNEVAPVSTESTQETQNASVNAG